MNFETARAAMAAEGNAIEIATDLLAEMSPEEKLWCLDGDAPFWAGLPYLGTGGYHRTPFHGARNERLGIPGVSFSDGPRGVVVNRASCFPVSMARGASWDLDLEERIGDAIGQELRAVGANLFGGICVNILRHPAWGRAQETYGEDPFHVGEFGAALARGVQRHTMACVKHFACNSMENARFSVDIVVDEVALHEVYLPHFKRVIDEGVACVMSAYNQVNGEWCGDSKPLLTDILRTEWGFEGFVISDWIFGMRDAAASVTAGLDIEMPYRMMRATNLADALADGRASWADVDRSVIAILSTLLRFDHVLARPQPPLSVLAVAEHLALAREAATKSMVLLRNEVVDDGPVLPLRPTGSIALIGELAAAINLGDGGSSDVWAPEVVTILDGLRLHHDELELNFHDGVDLDAAGLVAAAADVAVVVVGYTFLDEGEFIGAGGTQHLRALMPGPDDPQLAAAFNAAIAADAYIQAPAHIGSRATGGFAVGGDRSSLRLSDHHVATIRAAAAANKRTVVVIVAGSAVVVADWDHEVAAIVQLWYSGAQGGSALADVLFGDVEPQGRLPFSVPADEAHLPVFDRDAESFTYDRWHGWWHLRRQGHAAAYPFGFGLGYTSFTLDTASIAVNEATIAVEAHMTNIGERHGCDLIQVYSQRIGGDGPARLVGFARSDAAPGESVSISLVVDINTLAERDVAMHSMRVISGNYEIRVARHAGDPGIASIITVAS